MCGIIAYTGNKDAVTVVLECLKKLEYRGYDSWGIAAVTGDSISQVKRVGKIGEVGISQVKEAIKSENHTAIAHTRWATHGGVTQQNAHPHLDCTGTIAVVHNGIVDNHDELKGGLAGHRFI